MTPFRILRIIARLNVGGPARHVGLLASGLRARGYDTLVVFGEADETEGSFEDLLGPECGERIKLSGLGRRISVGGDLKAFIALLRLMFRLRPDIIHTHTAKAGSLGRVAAAIYNLTRPRDRRALVVHTFHGNVLDGYFSAPLKIGRASCRERV